MLLTTGISSYASTSPEEQATICAQENIPKYLDRNEKYYDFFNFSSSEDIKNAYLGKPIPYVEIANNTLKTVKIFKDDKKLNDYTQFSDFYVFPVMVNGKAVTDFTIILDDGKWRPYSFGGNLSAVIEDIASQNGYETEDCVILKSPTLYPTLPILVNSDKKEHVYLPYHNDLEMGFKAKEPIPSEDFVDALKKKIEKNEMETQSKSEITFGNSEF